MQDGTVPALCRLACQVQRFDFGPTQDRSLAGQLFRAGPHAQYFSRPEDDEKTPYAEFWVGATHTKGVSKLLAPKDVEGADLNDALLGKHKELMSSGLLDRYPKLSKDEHGGMPFIFKVLSAGKALPLQVHPDMKSSEGLRRQKKSETPDETVFDSMHKPEIAIAITEFTGFVGFAEKAAIQSRLKTLSQLRSLTDKSNARMQASLPLSGEDNIYDLAIGDEGSAQHAWKDIMAAFIGRLLCADETKVAEAIEGIARREEAASDGEVKTLLPLVRKLKGQHGNDIGVLLAPALMNVITIQPGECIYAPADTVHAWLSGDIIECMPSSVNVINTAFGPTPSEETVELWTQMLSYAFLPEENFKVQPRQVSNSVSQYSTPIEEFEICRVQLDADGSCELFADSPLNGIAVLIAIDGSGHITGRLEDRTDQYLLAPAECILISNGCKVELQAAKEGLHAFVCFATC